MAKKKKERLVVGPVWVWTRTIPIEAQGDEDGAEEDGDMENVMDFFPLRRLSLPTRTF